MQNKKCRHFYTEELMSLQTMSTSKGNQLKWYDEQNRLYIKAQFCYQGKLWRDDLVEVIGSHIGAQMKLTDKAVCVLHQELCEIHDHGKLYHGVYSNDFCRNEERFFPFYRLLQINGLEFPYRSSIGEKWKFVLDTMRVCTGLDYTDYLVAMTMIDILVGNEDRHLSNFGVLANESFRIPPLFDKFAAAHS